MVEENWNRFLEEEEWSFLSPEDSIFLFDLTQKEVNILVWLIIEWMNEHSTENPETTYKNLILEKKYEEAINFCDNIVAKIGKQIIVTESDPDNKKLEKLKLSLIEIKKSWKNRREVATTFLERNL